MSAEDLAQISQIMEHGRVIGELWTDLFLIYSIFQWSTLRFCWLINWEHLPTIIYCHFLCPNCRVFSAVLTFKNEFNKFALTPASVIQAISSTIPRKETGRVFLYK